MVCDLFIYRRSSVATDLLYLCIPDVDRCMAPGQKGAGLYFLQYFCMIFRHAPLSGCGAMTWLSDLCPINANV